MKVGRLVIFTNPIKRNNSVTIISKRRRKKQLRGRKKDKETKRVKTVFLSLECQYFHWSTHNNLLTLYFNSFSARACSKKEYCFVLIFFMVVICTRLSIYSCYKATLLTIDSLHSLRLCFVASVVLFNPIFFVYTNHPQPIPKQYVDVSKRSNISASF